MCAPAAVLIPVIASAAVSAAGTGAAYASQQANANAQAGYEGSMYTQTAKAAKQNYFQQMAQEQFQVNQIGAQAAQQSQDTAVAAEQARGRAAATMGQRGVIGNSVDALLNDFERVEQGNQTILSQNMAWRRQQAGQDMASFQAQAQARIAGATPAPVPMPSLLAAGLQIGGTALKAYDTSNYYGQQGAYNPNNYAGGTIPPPLVGNPPGQS